MQRRCWGCCARRGRLLSGCRLLQAAHQLSGGKAAMPPLSRTLHSPRRRPHSSHRSKAASIFDHGAQRRRPEQTHFLAIAVTEHSEVFVGCKVTGVLKGSVSYDLDNSSSPFCPLDFGLWRISCRGKPHPHSCRAGRYCGCLSTHHRPTSCLGIRNRRRLGPEPISTMLCQDPGLPRG